MNNAIAQFLEVGSYREIIIINNYLEVGSYREIIIYNSLESAAIEKQGGGRIQQTAERWSPTHTMSYTDFSILKLALVQLSVPNNQLYVQMSPAHENRVNIATSPV